MDNIVVTEQQIGKLYELIYMGDNSDVYTSDAVFTTRSSTTVLWPKRLAHIYQRAVVGMSGSVGIPATLSHDTHKQCIPCLLDKMEQLLFWAATQRTLSTLKLVHIYMFARTRNGPINGSYYCLVITNDFTKKRDAECLSQKNQLMQRFQQWKTQAEKHFDSHDGYLLEVLRRDQRGEGASKTLER